MFSVSPLLVRRWERRSEGKPALSHVHGCFCIKILRFSIWRDIVRKEYEDESLGVNEKGSAQQMAVLRAWRGVRPRDRELATRVDAAGWSLSMLALSSPTFRGALKEGWGRGKKFRCRFLIECHPRVQS